MSAKLSQRFRARQQNCRLNKGSAIAELSAGLIFLSVFVLASINCSLILYGAFHNDRICRSVARAAAQGASPIEALKFANAALKNNDPAVTWIEPPQLNGAIIYEDYGGKFKPNQSPYVTVTTTTKVSPIFPTKFFTANLLPGKIEFVQTYTFPIVRVQ
jgi:hypothetical protein